MELYEAGHTMARLAGRYGVCETVIYNRLTEAGAPIRHKTGNFKPVDARAMPSFDVYWALKTAPGADAAVVDRLAVWQIWPMLRPLHQMAFLALAAHGDYAKAAAATGYPYNSFSVLITAARAEFLRLWHEGETPSRIWAADQHGSTDPALRARRVLAARRRRKHEHPPGTGPAPVQATA